MNTFYDDDDDTEYLLYLLNDYLSVLPDASPNFNRQKPKITAEQLWNSS